MTWLNETEPFELKPHITRKRVMRGLTPERRKWKDASQLRKQIRLYQMWSISDPYEWFGIDTNGIPYRFDENGKKTHYVAGWNRDIFDGKPLPGNGKKQRDNDKRVGKSSRIWMRMVASWWTEASEVQP